MPPANSGSASSASSRAQPFAPALESQVESMIDRHLIEQGKQRDALVDHLASGAVSDEMVLRMFGHNLATPPTHDRLSAAIDDFLGPHGTSRLRKIAKEAFWGQHVVKINLKARELDKGHGWIAERLRSLGSGLQHLEIHAVPNHPRKDATVAELSTALLEWTSPRIGSLRTRVVVFEYAFGVRTPSIITDENMRWFHNLKGTGFDEKVARAVKALQYMKAEGRVRAVGIALTCHSRKRGSSWIWEDCTRRDADSVVAAMFSGTQHGYWV